MLVAFGVGITSLKFKEGAPTLILSELIKCEKAYGSRRRGDL